MLKLILGTAGTGKSEYIKNMIYKLASEGTKSLLLVPEQFSKTGEVEIFSGLEKSQFSLVRAFSFTSLLRDVQSETGRATKPVLTKAGKAVLAKRSLDNVYKHLNAYHTQKKNLQFSFDLSEIFDDFKRAGIDGVTLYKIAEGASAKSGKLKDIALIYSEYCANLTGGFCDAEDLLVDLGQTLPLSYTDKAEIFVDSFESFSFGQYKILQKMMENADNVTIALAADSLYDKSEGTGRLCYTKNTAARLISLAKKSNVQTASPTILNEQYRFKNKTLKAIDALLLQKEVADIDREGVAFVNTFKNQYCEVSFVCAEITKLVKSGYQYDDIAVVCPQLEKYENQLQESLLLAEIPYFIDQSRIISSSGAVLLIKCILAIMNDGINEDTILPLLKTGLTHFDEETVSLLENYMYLWQEQGLDWKRSFELSPYGIIGSIDEKGQQLLEEINDLVAKVKAIFTPFVQPKQGGKSSEILAFVYEIIEALDSENILTQQIVEQGKTDPEKSELILRQWESVIECLEQLYKITKEDVFKPLELSDLFMLMISGTKLGFAPQTQDCVMVSTPQRMKIDSVKAVLVIGASQDMFPSLIGEGKLISAADRQLLKDNELELGNGFEEKYSFENLYFYKTLTTASEKLFISCARKNIDTQEILSSEIEEIKKRLSLEKAPMEESDYCITKEFFTQFISETEPQKAREILSALDIETTYITQKLFKVLDIENIASLLGEEMTISPTGAESYYKCAFSYFLQKLLGIRPLEKASITQREAGDYLHYVAQMVLGKYKGDYYKTSWDVIEREAKGVVQEYIQNNYAQQVRESERFASLSENMQENALQLLKYMHEEQNASEFRPIAFEQSIGFGSDIPPLNLAIDNGKSVSVRGVCDRIDLLQKDGIDYIRIVDYKTGTKDFKLDDIYNGLSSQLLLYMSAVVDSHIQGVKNPKPAAVIYQPSDPNFKFDRENEKLYTAVGMAVDDPAVSKAFDTSEKGNFGVLKTKVKEIIEKDKVTKEIKEIKIVKTISSLSGSEVVSEKLFNIILEYTKDKVKQMASEVYNGNFDSLPLDLGQDKTACQWCNFGCVCQSKDRTKEKERNNFKEMEAQTDGENMD